MKIVWRLQSCQIKEVVEEFPEPKPAYNTVGTFLKLLEEKGYVKRVKRGGTFIYFPSIKIEAFSSKNVKQLLSNYFDNSADRLLSFMAEDKQLSIAQIERLLEKLKKDE
jgi:predicted transcriptional regulator